MPAEPNNKYAVKSEDGLTATSFIHLRCTPRDKARWVKAAQGRKMKLAEWVIEVLNARSGQ